jgi:hypothetical protein
MSFKALHHDHLADLRRSGLSDETIRTAGIYTVQPSDIGKKLGGGDAGMVSLLAFPYSGCGDFERYRCFYENGKTGPKYRQPKGMPNRLYIPPGVDLTGDEPIILTEGEKKTLKLAQEGFPALGIGGVWNWLTKGDGEESGPIGDLDLVNWRRPVTIVFDSDGSNNQQVRLAAFRLARELTRRGASVSILFLPHGKNGQKQGADDFLIAHGSVVLRDATMATAWPFDPALDDLAAEISWHLRKLTPESSTSDKLKALPNLVPTLARMSNTALAARLEDLRSRIKLRVADLAGLKADIKTAQKAVGKKSDQASPTLTLDELEDIRRCHAATDFLGGPVPQAMTFGFRAPTPDGKEGLLLVFSDSRGVTAMVNPESVKVEKIEYRITGGCPPLLEDVWSLRSLKTFVEAPTQPAELYQDLVTAFKTYLDLQDPAAFGFMAAWTVATYFTQIFAAVPFIHFYGPKDSGKSKALEALRFTCLNAYKGRDITAAALGDTVDGMRGTVLIDQAERLGMVSKAGESTVNLVGLLADSYKKAGGKRRVVEMTAGGRRVLEFSTFGFKGFASTKNLDPDLADRCIPVSMIKTRKHLPDLEGHEPVWAKLRDQNYRFALGSFKKVAAAYQAIQGNGSRIIERWRPLAAVLTALDVEKAEFEAVRQFFMSKAEDARYGPDGWELSVLEALENRAQASPEFFEMTADDIIEAMEVDSKEKPGAKWVGEALGKFNLFNKKRRVKRNRKKVTVYTFNRLRVLQIIETFLSGHPQNDLSPLSPDDNNNESSELQGTGQKAGTCPYLSPRSFIDKSGGDRPGPVPVSRHVSKKVFETIDEKVTGTDGTGKTEDIVEKQKFLFSGNVFDPLEGEI